MNHEPIPNTLREHRKKAGLTQLQVAHQLNFRSSDRISRWEKGLTYPHVVNLFKMAKLYGVKAEELYTALFL
jgi:transcriptional regulator with XRE-family HTH domain